MVWDKAVRREIALACQIGEEHEGVAEDLLMVLPILDRVGRFYYIDQPLYRYRAVLDSRSNAFTLSPSGSRSRLPERSSP